MPPIALSDKERAMMLGMATAALQHAYAPYSKFRVGATVITDDAIFIPAQTWKTPPMA